MLAVMDRTALLRTIPMFEELAAEDLEALAGTLVEKRFTAGELIVNMGEPGTEMYVVAEGHVNIHLPGEGSRRVSLKDISRGEYFGELALFDDKPRSASALATTDTVLLELGRDTLSKYLQKRPHAAMAILRTMAERLRETNAMLSERAAKNVVEEIEKNLSWQDKLADRIAELNGSWAFILLLVGLTLTWAIINAPPIARMIHLTVVDESGKTTGFDPYPFILYNLVLAILVALQGPLIVMSQNRQVMKDRKTAETDFKVNLKNEVNIETILRELGEFRAEANTRLETLEKRTGVAKVASGESKQPEA
jgi:uncharacterized membrane protein